MRHMPLVSPIGVLCCASFLAIADPVCSRANEESRSGVKEVVVVFKTHFDIGYTDLARNVVKRYRTSMIDKALAVCDDTKELPPDHRFVWTLPGWPMHQILWPGQTADRRNRLNRAVRSGRLVWHALPGSLHTESLELEDIVRGLRFSASLSHSFHMPPPRDAKMTDVPSHVWALPTILKHAGVDFLHLGCNSASASPEVPLLFWWEGPDGSRLLTMYEASGYGSRLQPPDGWPHKTWLALIHTGDNHGPPAPGTVQKLLDDARKNLPGVNVRMGRLSDFGDAILAEKPELPVVRADMPDTWIHGIMSMPIETKIARNTRPQIAALESLNTLLQCWGVDAEPAQESVSSAYEGSLMYGEHTWGASVPLDKRLYGKAWQEELAAGKYAQMEESWREHGAYIRTAQDLVCPALAANMRALARAVNVDGPRVVVFNPLPWKRDDVVTVEGSTSPGTSWKDVATGETISAERNGNSLRLLVRRLPPLGYRTYVPAVFNDTHGDVSVDSASGVIENSRYRVQLDTARGVIASLTDKLSGREFVDSDSTYGLGQYLYERFDADDNQRYIKGYCKYIPGWVGHFSRFDMPPADEVPYSATSPKDFRLEIQRSDLATTATMTAESSPQMPHAVTLRVTLYHDLPCVDLEWKITNKQPDTWPEAGWLCLPLAIDQPNFRLGRLGAIVDPSTDTVRGANHEVFCLNSGMSVTGADGKGIGFCPADSPLVSIGRPGIWRHSKEFGQREPVVFVNLFNNVWGTNFQQWIRGSWSSRVRLWAVDGGEVERDLITPSRETRSRAMAAMFDGSAGNLTPAQSGVELSEKGVLVTAFEAYPNGNGILLRLWEQAGVDRECRVQLPAGLRVTEAQPCDLRGLAVGAPIRVHKGSLNVSLKDYAPYSLSLQTSRNR